MTSDSPTPKLPASIGRFRIDALLGRGGMGEVYKAFDATLQRPVALKTVRTGIDSPESLARLFREAQACARLRHQNIVTVHEAGDADGVVYIIMEFLEGTDLAAALKHPGLSMLAKLRVLTQVLDALEHAHSQQVIHRDIKPSNVFCLADGTIKVVDFGLARVTHNETMTATGMAMGTPHYASPEQLRAEAVDHRSDIYSTGAMAYELIDGHRPFDHDGSTLTSVILKAISEPPAPMSSRWAKEFPALERIVQRTLAKEPKDRYQSAREMRDAVSSFIATEEAFVASFEQRLKDELDAAGLEATRLGGLSADVPTAMRSTVGPAGSRSTPNTVTRAVQPAASAASAAISAPTTVAGAQPARSRVRAGAAAALVLAVAAGFVWWSMRQSEPTVDPAAAASSATAESAGGTVVPSATAASGGAANAPTTANPSATTPRLEAPQSAATPTPQLTAAVATPANSEPAPMPPAATPAPEVAVNAVALFAGTPGTAVNTGLQYRVTRQAANGSLLDVDTATTTFRSGDRIRLAFHTNVDGHLYVAQEGTSGRWSVLFPSPDINGGRNAVRKGQEYRVPDDDWFEFTGPPGNEHVFVFFSPQPLTQLPGFDRPLGAPATLMASVVDNLRGRIQSRDLVLAKSKPQAANATGIATYVVNRAEVGQAVTTSFTLKHEP